MHAAKKALVVTAGVAVILVTSVMAISYSSGPGTCTYPNERAMSASGEGTGGFEIAVSADGEAIENYEPGATYTVTLSAPRPYKGFLLQSVAGAPGAPNEKGVGEFVELADQYRNAPCRARDASVGHSMARRKAPAAADTFTWKAPEAGIGDVTFHAVGVYSRTEWHGKETLITTTLREVSGE